MMNNISLIVMIGVLGWNVHGILEVGAENASGMQWAFAGLMSIFVANALRRL